MSSYWEPCLTAAQASAIAKIANGTTSIPVVRPNLAAAAGMGSNAIAYTYGAAVQIVAANDLASHMLVGIAPHFLGSSQDWQLELRSATAGGGTLYGEWSFTNVTSVWFSGFIPVVPGITLPANSAVFGRVAAGGAGGASFGVKLHFIPRPLA